MDNGGMALDNGGQMTMGQNVVEGWWRLGAKIDI